MNCVNCGNPMNDGDRFCMNCGFAAAAAAAPVVDAPVVDAPVVDAAPIAETAPVDVAPVEAAPVVEPIPTMSIETPIEAAPVEAAPVVEPIPSMPVETPIDAAPAPQEEIQMMGEVPAYASNEPQVEVAPVPVPVFPVPDVAAPMEQPIAQAPMEQPVAQAPVDAIPTAPMQDPNMFATQEAPVDYLAEAQAKKAELENMFQRKSWKDENTNNGGIVNRGPVNR